MKKIISILVFIMMILPGTSFAAKWTLKYGHVGPATDISDGLLADLNNIKQKNIINNHQRSKFFFFLYLLLLLNKLIYSLLLFLFFYY